MEWKETLGDRMKAYEALCTSPMLMPHAPVYARLDGRAFHTLCRGFNKPWDERFGMLMRSTCRHLVSETGAAVGYVQSDEISLGWADYTKAPFMGRIFKLLSVLASEATAGFAYSAFECLDSDDPCLERILKMRPTFDCRVFNVPDMHELALQFLFRANDAAKNAINAVSEKEFGRKAIEGKNVDERLEMLEAAGRDFDGENPFWFRQGSFFRRENFMKKFVGDDGVERECMRSEVRELVIPGNRPLKDVMNKAEFLFGRECPIFPETQCMPPDTLLPEVDDGEPLFEGIPS